ncbi:DUF465 domain-containing protein [Beggiatoa alba]|nr:DUF465 domain-containing protein [Beggiatoa alba]
MDPKDQAKIHHQISELINEHRDLDEIITKLTEAEMVDQLQISRLKKRKLKLKDKIHYFEDLLIPDMDA